LSLNNSFLQIHAQNKETTSILKFRKLVLPNFAQLMWVFGVLPNPVLTRVLTMVKTARRQKLPTLGYLPTLSSAG